MKTIRPKLLIAPTIVSAFRHHSNNGDYSKRQITDQIRKLQEKVAHARELFMSGDFKSTDIQEVKAKCEKEIFTLEKKLPDILQSIKIVDQLLTGAISNIKKLSYSHKSGNSAIKRKIISSIDPKNLTFDGYLHRTNRSNEIIDCNMLITKNL